MNNNYYNVNYSRLINLLLPPFLRKPVMVALGMAMMRPLDAQHREFMKYQSSIDVQVYSQVCYMQGLLNDRFDYYDRRIIVRNIEIDYQSNLIRDKRYSDRKTYPAKEYNPPYLFMRKGFIGADKHDFEIVLPKGFELSINEMNVLQRLVNTNKLASKYYKITYE